MLEDFGRFWKILGCDAVQSSSLELDLVCLPFSSGQSAIRFQAPGLIGVGQRLAPLSKARTFLSGAKLSPFFFALYSPRGGLMATMTQLRRSARLALAALQNTVSDGDSVHGRRH